MIVLGLDTTGADCAVSIVDDARIRAHISRRIGRGHAEVLAGMVAEAFEAAKLQPADISRLAVCTGPGSFTGLRVALSFALGFALPRDLPVIGIDALDVAAHPHQTHSPNAMITVMRDVRRGEVFFAAYRDTPVGLQSVTPPRAMPLAEAQAKANALRADLHEAATIDTRILAWLALDRDPATHSPEPFYARAPDAKLPGGRSL